jgi:HAE1 family hydrophobic/amphiphilic exporter-1
MHPIEAFVRNPVKVAVGVILVTLFGVIALFRMPMQLTPEVQIPTISVTTMWPGASPQEVEREIIQEQEEQLKAVENVTKMTSEATDSLGTITLEFVVGTDMSESLLMVNSRLQQVPEYPEDADEPVIATSNSSDSPIAWFILTARMPDPEVFEAFVAKHPQLKEMLQPVMKAHSSALAELRLRRLVTKYGEKHPELKELMPPPIDVPSMRKFAEDEIEAQFERVSGVSNSNVLGGRDPELQIVVDPEKLAARQLTIQDVRKALRAQNKDTSGGDLWEGKRRWVVRTLGQFREPQQVENQILATSSDGSPVYIRDVADVVLTHKKPDGFVKRFGTTCIAVNVVRRTGANVLEVMEGLKEENARLNEGILKEQHLTLKQVYDETEYIDAAIHRVEEDIFIGAALTMLSLMLFLHPGTRTMVCTPIIILTSLAAVYISPWFFLVTIALIVIVGFWFARGALVVSLAIPVSIIGTFMIMLALGRSVNVISLAGLAFAVGMFIDNAVVVLEDIVRHHQNGETPVVAAQKATKEVWGAVLASSLTNMAVFVPILFIQEEAGQLFSDIALAISGALLMSVFVSITVIPTAAARLLKHMDETGDSADVGAAAQPERGGFWGAASKITTPLTNGLDSFAEGFVRVLLVINTWIQYSTMRRLALVLGMVFLSTALTWLFWPKVEYLPNGNRNLVFGIVLPPPGYNVEELGKLGQIVEDELAPLWNVDPDSPEAKKLKYPPIQDFFYVARGRQVFIGLRAHDENRAAELVPALMELTPKLPGSFLVAQQSSLFARGLQAGRTIDIEITGPSLEKLVGYGGMIFGQITPTLEPERTGANANPANPTQTQARPIPSLDLSSPEVHVSAKLVQSAGLEMSNEDLGYTINALVDGAYAADYFEGATKIDMSIVGNIGGLGSTGKTQDIEALPIAVAGGKLVTVGSVADVTLSSGPEQINHRERQRAITVQVTPPPAMALEDAIERINKQIIDPMRQNKVLAPQYNITLSGTADKLSQTWKSLRWNLLFAVVLTYLLMAALFESWTHPFVIILSVPLGAVGGILGLNLLNVYLAMQGQAPQSLDVLTMLGFVILIGTVVNNPILIVHQALNHMREDGMRAREAVLESTRTRIRPIFITTLTTVISLAPLALFPGAGSELYRGIGSVLLGGLVVSTFLTLVLIPALFTLAIDVQDFVAMRLGIHSNQHPLIEQDEFAEAAVIGSNGSAAELEAEKVGA